MKLKKFIKSLDRTVDTIVLGICMILLLIGTYSMLDNIWVYNNASDDSLFEYKPDLNEPLTEDRKITENQVAWIEIYDTGIDYPVMQGEDNMEYLNKNPYGEFSLSGSIFLDFRNDKYLTDDYSIIYGHHMENNLMFGVIDEYALKEGFFESHKKGRIVTEAYVYDIDLFAVVSETATNEYLFNPGFCSKSELYDYIESHAKYFSAPNRDKNIIALSTCSGSNDLDRLLIIGTLTETG